MARDMAEFMASIMVKEGCWVVEPTKEHNDSYILSFLDRLRHIPARIWCPPGRPKYRFAERNADGNWFFIWVPDQHN